MSWLRLDDKFGSHPKILALTDREFRAHVLALCYAAEYATNGVVPRSAWRTLGITTPIARRLLELGLWDDQDGETTIHDWRAYNPADPTSATRKARYRERHRNATGTFEERPEERNRNGSHARASAPVPVPSLKPRAVDEGPTVRTQHANADPEPPLDEPTNGPGFQLKEMP